MAQDRLQSLPDGRVLVELKTAWRDGTTHLVFESLEFLEKLAALTPRPRIHLILSHGVLPRMPGGGAASFPRLSWTRERCRWSPPMAARGAPGAAAPSASRPPRSRWADLLRWGFDHPIIVRICLVKELSWARPPAPGRAGQGACSAQRRSSVMRPLQRPGRLSSSWTKGPAVLRWAMDQRSG